MWIDADKTPEKRAKERAIGKVKLVILENGGNKEDIETDYKRGIVWWQDERVAEWKESRGKIEIKGKAKELEGKVREALGE